jgi:hypothetical protein
MFKYFMECYFNQSVDYQDLYELVKEFKKSEISVRTGEFISELKKVMERGDYDSPMKVIDDHGERVMSKRRLEEFIRYIHARLKGKKPRLTLEQLINIR